jgi:phosphatidylserine decarboxylase
MRIAKDGWPLIIGLPALGVALGWGLRGLQWPAAGMVVAWIGVLGGAFMVYFFRDPERFPPDDPACFVAGADGWVRAIEDMREDRYLKTDCVRISIFLTPFDVHVNRSPLAGKVTSLGYTPGRHLLTIQNAASEHNEHSTILIEGEKTRCLVKQIVGPIVRRVVYWLEVGQQLAKGDRIGMMKFGSRLDMLFPKSDVEVRVAKGDKVRAGETVVAVLKKG